jgi:hypothetical protein
MVDGPGEICMVADPGTSCAGKTGDSVDTPKREEKAIPTNREIRISLIPPETPELYTRLKKRQGTALLINSRLEEGKVGNRILSHGIQFSTIKRNEKWIEWRPHRLRLRALCPPISLDGCTPGRNARP